MAKFKYHGRLISASTKAQAVRKIIAASPRKFRQPEYMRDGGKDPDFKETLDRSTRESLEKKVVDFYDYATDVIEGKACKGVFCDLSYESSDGTEFSYASDDLIRDLIVTDIMTGKECWLFARRISLVPSEMGITGDSLPPEFAKALDKELGGAHIMYDGNTNPSTIKLDRPIEIYYQDMNPSTVYVCKLNDIKANKGELESSLNHVAGEFAKKSQEVVDAFNRVYAQFSISREELEKDIVDFYDHAVETFEKATGGKSYVTLHFESSQDENFGIHDDYKIEYLVDDILAGKDCWLWVQYMSIMPNSIGIQNDLPEGARSAINQAVGFPLWYDMEQTTKGTITPHQPIDVDYSDLVGNTYVCRLNDIVDNRKKLESDMVRKSSEFASRVNEVVDIIQSAAKSYINPAESYNKLSDMIGEAFRSTGVELEACPVYINIESSYDNRIASFLVDDAGITPEGSSKSELESQLDFVLGSGISGFVDLTLLEVQVPIGDWPEQITKGGAKALNAMCSNEPFDSDGHRISDELDIAFDNVSQGIFRINVFDPDKNVISKFMHMCEMEFNHALITAKNFRKSEEVYKKDTTKSVDAYNRHNRSRR